MAATASTATQVARARSGRDGLLGEEPVHVVSAGRAVGHDRRARDAGEDRPQRLWSGRERRRELLGHHLQHVVAVVRSPEARAQGPGGQEVGAQHTVMLAHASASTDAATPPILVG